MKSRTVGSRPFRNILCPIDFSDQSRDALRTASEVAGAPPARITVLYVHSDHRGSRGDRLSGCVTREPAHGGERFRRQGDISQSRANDEICRPDGQPLARDSAHGDAISMRSDRDGIKRPRRVQEAAPGIDDRPCGPPCRGSRARRQVEDAGAPADVETSGYASTPPGGLTQRLDSCASRCGPCSSPRAPRHLLFADLPEACRRRTSFPTSIIVTGPSAASNVRAQSAAESGEIANAAWAAGMW